MRFLLLLISLFILFSIKAQDYSFYEFVADGVQYKCLILNQESTLNLALVPESEISGVLSKNETVCISEVGFYDNGGNHIGLLQKEGQQISGIDIASSGKGNFYLVPNGVLSFDSLTIQITESKEYNTRTLQEENSIQSGPLLIMNGKLHPKLNLFSPNKHGRSAICTITQNNERFILFVTALDPVNMYTFSVLIKQRFNCDFALLVGSGNTCTNFSPSRSSCDIPSRPWYLVATY